MPRNDSFILRIKLKSKEYGGWYSVDQLSKNRERAYTSSSLAPGWSGRQMSATFWRPSLKAFIYFATVFKAIQILHEPLENLDDIAVEYDFLIFNLSPTPLFLFWKHSDNTRLDRQLTRDSVHYVSAYAKYEKALRYGG